MQILLVDDDPIFRDLTAAVLRERTEHDVLAVADARSGLQLALTAPSPFLLILDWVMPEMTGTQLCRLVRAAPLDPQPHVLFITARVRREEIIECMAAGADDLLTKPVAPDVLVARVQLAARRREQPVQGANAVRRALTSAADEQDGELVIRSGNLCARVLFAQGMVAWAQVVDGSGSLLDALVPEAGIDAETARSIVAECRRSGKSLTDTLAAWGLVERSRLRGAMSGWLRRKLATIHTLPDPQTLFLPQKYAGAVDLLFPLHELVDELEQSPLVSVAAERPPALIPSEGWDAAFQPSVAPNTSVDGFLRRCMRIDGVTSVAVVDRLTGECFGRTGSQLDPDVAWAQLKTLNAVMHREPIEDIIVTSTAHIHLMVLIPQLGGAFAYVVANPRQTTAAAVRIAVRSSAVSI